MELPFTIPSSLLIIQPIRIGGCRSGLNFLILRCILRCGFAGSFATQCS